MSKKEQQEIKQLRAKVRELELIVSTKTKLIEILKSMPGCQGVTLKDEKAKRVPARGKKGGGPVAHDGSTRESGDNRKRPEGHDKDSKELENQV